MPIYEYRCTTCGHTFEVFAKMSDPAPEACESCQASTLEKVLHPVSVHYKGSGFYATDYGSKKKASSTTGEGSGASTDTSSKDSGSSSSDSGTSSGGSSTDSSSGSSGASTSKTSD